MKAILLLTLLLVACAAPQLELEKPTLPTTENRVIQGGNSGNQPTPSSTAQERLDELFLQEPPSEYQITIELQSFFNNTRVTETITRSVAGEDVATQVFFEGQVVLQDFFVDGEATVCFLNETWDCVQPPEPEFEEPPEVEFEEPTVTQLPGRLFAGVRADCFELQYREGREELCLGEGVVLYRKTTIEQDEFVEQVTSFARSVPTNAFQPPGDVS